MKKLSHGRTLSLSGVVLLLLVATQLIAQELPKTITKEELETNNKLFLEVARKALKWEEPAEPVRIAGPRTHHFLEMLKPDIWLAQHNEYYDLEGKRERAKTEGLKAWVAYPKANDGKTVYKLTVKDVPVDGFWSISVYNSKGFFEKNDLDTYSLNNLTAKPNADGSFTIQFGGCTADTINCLPIVAGWNYTVRLYRPRKEILNGTWKFPDARPVT